MSTAVVSDDTISLVRQEEHLRFEVVGIQGPAVREDDGWRGFVLAPDLVVDLGPILDGKVRHRVDPNVRWKIEVVSGLVLLSMLVRLHSGEAARSYCGRQRGRDS